MAWDMLGAKFSQFTLCNKPPNEPARTQTSSDIYLQGITLKEKPCGTSKEAMLESEP